MKVILSGGGTGGHIYPAIAIGQEIEKTYPASQIYYVGIEGGPEERVAKQYGYDFIPIDGMGIPRKINKKFFKSIGINMKGLRDAKKIIRDIGPDIVIGTGGYVCGPILYEASKKGIPSLIHESNSYPGVTSKFLSKKVDHVLISYDQARDRFDEGADIILTGNPVRNSFDLSYSEGDLDKLGIKKDRPVVFSFGGSNGSYYMNQAVKEMSFIMDGDFYLLHQTGSRYYEDFLSEYNKDNPYIKVFDYIDNIDLFYGVSDLIIASSGAMSLSEISAVKKASILIPKSYTTENHQEYNARTYVEGGASHMILEKDLTGEVLYKEILSIISDKEKLEEMGKRAGDLADDAALDKIMSIIKSLLDDE